MAYRILLICTGNVCRSPLAEHLLTAALDPPFEVVSRGTHAWPGHEFSPEMATLLHSRAGLDPGRRGAVQLRGEDVRDADLVLGMEREHRSAAVLRHPAIVRRAFTLREFSRLLANVDTIVPTDAAPQERMTLLVRAAHAGRRPVPPELDDIVDPIGRSHAVYQAVFDQIAAAVRQIAGVIGSQE